MWSNINIYIYIYILTYFSYRLSGNRVIIEAKFGTVRPTPTDAIFGVICHFAVKKKVQPTLFFERHFGVNGVGEHCHSRFGVVLFTHAILLLPFFFFFF